MTVTIAQLSLEHHHNGFGIFAPKPRISWRFNSTTTKNWVQSSYELVIRRQEKEEYYKFVSPDSVFVPWPSSPLQSRERATIKVRATGVDGSCTDWAALEAEVALLDATDWSAATKLISGPAQGPAPKRPFLLRKTFQYQYSGTDSSSARLYATAHGVYEVEVNGSRVGDQVLAPGWQAYHHHLHYQIYDITPLLQNGDNVIGVQVAEGWYSTRLGRPGVPNHWGERPSFFAQLEIGGKVVCVTDSSWEYLDGSLVLSELYNGEIYDTNLEDPNWSTASFQRAVQGRVEEVGVPAAKLIAPDYAPVRRILEIKPKELITTPTGRRVLDFGQNFVGWLRIERDIPGNQGESLVIKHAEVLENGELATRPLRSAAATHTVLLGGKTKGLEAKFTFYGFRYAEISG